MSKYEENYERDTGSVDMFIYEAVYYGTHHPSVEIKNKFIAYYPEEVTDYLEQRLLATVKSVRLLGTAQAIL